ncbi:MAG: hypothetical protein PF517_01580 [Salinivirgaceae bacterium]|jgi:hypothetical protein|nr:hypothetical protein [Salinivirgaceae bacterium]
MSYLLLIIYTALLLYFINKAKFYKSNLFPKYIPSLIFITKFIGGLGVYLVYSYFYGSRMSGDIFKYFDDGNIIHSSIQQNPIDYIRMVTGIGSNSPHLDQYYDTCRFWHKQFNYGLINDNRIVIRFNALVRLFSMGNFHIHTLIISFLSFTGLWAIFKLFEKSFSNQKWVLLFMVFFLPSLYFWSSGVLKEGILMFAFGMFLYHIYYALLKKGKTKNYIWVALSIFILLISKFYVLVAVIPGIVFFFIIRKTNKKWFFWKLAFVIFGFVLLGWVTKPIIGISFIEVLAKKQNDFIASVNTMNYVGSKIEIPILEPTLKSIVLNSPSAFFRTLFRPSVFEIANLMSLMAVFENILIIVFMAVAALFFSIKNIKNEALWFCIIFVLILFTLSGLTTPVLGALVRYKSPALPFLGIAIMYFVDFDKLKIFIDKIKTNFTAIK